MLGRRSALGVVLAVAALGLAACGDDDDAAPASAGATTQASTASAAPSEAAPEGIAVEPKTIGVVEIARAAPVEDRMDTTLERAGEALGWEVKVADAGGDPTKFNAAIGAFATQKVDALIAVSNGVSGAQRPIRQLRQAGVPIIQIGGGDEPSDLVDAQYTEDEREIGTLLAQRIVDDHPDGAKIGDLTLSVVFATREREEALQEVVGASSSEIAASAEFDLADPVVSTRKVVTDMLTAEPDIDAIWGVSDVTVAPSLSAIRQKRSDAQVYSFFSSPPNLEALREDTALAAVADANLNQTAAVAMDQLVYHFQEDRPIDPDALSANPIEYTIVDRDNVPPEGTDVFPIDETLAPFIEKWTKDFPAG